MDLETSIKQYKKNIEKLAQKNGTEYEIMLENWESKFKDFDRITDQYGFSSDKEEYLEEERKPVIALTVNGSILIVSEAKESGERKIRYQAIKLRNDESQNVPEVMTGILKGKIALSKPALFDGVLETSPIIKIKTSNNFDWDKFESTADNFTIEVTRKFEKIDRETVTKIYPMESEANRLL